MKRREIREIIVDGGKAGIKFLEEAINHDFDVDTDEHIKIRNEHIFTSFISRQLILEFGKDILVTHETSLNALVKNYTKTYEWPSKEFRENHTKYQFDLVLWEADNKPFSIVEVKRGESKKSIIKDAIKLATVMREFGKQSGGHLRNMMLAFPITRKGKQVANNRYIDIYDSLLNALEGKDASFGSEKFIFNRSRVSKKVNEVQNGDFVVIQIPASAFKK